MQRLIVFQNLSLDGYFVDGDGEMSWAKDDADAEFNAFVSDNAKGNGTLLFGRVTYELMASFWPTEMAHKLLPTVAERMNNSSKVVFSKTLDRATWTNSTLVKGDIVSEVRRMKNEPGEGMAILGSGNIVAQLANVIDEYQIVINPVALGCGRTMFEGIKKHLSLKLTNSRIFRNGKVFLTYEPSI